MILNYKKLVPFLFVVSWLPALVFAWLLVFVPVVSVRLYPLAVSIIGWVLAGLMLLVWGAGCGACLSFSHCDSRWNSDLFRA